MYSWTAAHDIAIFASQTVGGPGQNVRQGVLVVAKIWKSRCGTRQTGLSLAWRLSEDRRSRDMQSNFAHILSSDMPVMQHHFGWDKRRLEPLIVHCSILYRCKAHEAMLASSPRWNN